ncbi:DUF1642 domain-containing protein [Enterococcus thailandicus]|uniref:DUF1642 domain-containing protein n=1 Tax=Enterococcus thailandicus TaxID=417368 RepID=UPI0039A6C8CB
MNKQELIEKVAKRISPLEDFRGISGFQDVNYEGLEYALNLIQQLDEPQKPVVPKFVADLVNWTNKMQCAPSDIIQDFQKNGELANIPCNLELEKLSEYFEKAYCRYDFEKACFVGYEVEKEQLYVMPVPHVSFPVHYCVKDDHISFRQGNAQKFTQAELDKYFPDIKQFAVPVDEVEEG